jgi:sensor histidine kinase regulating citrate/malate metabolism
MIPKISSTALPKVAFNKAPIVEPDLNAISSVAVGFCVLSIRESFTNNNRVVYFTKS